MSNGVKTADREVVWIPTACNMCYNSCSIKVQRVNGAAVKIEGIRGAQPNYGKTCAKGNAAIMNLYNPHRILHPLRRTNPQKGVGIDPGWERISWDQALDLAETKLRAAREKDRRSVILASFDTITRPAHAAFMTAFGSPNVSPGASNFFCGRGLHPMAFTLTGSNDIHPDIKRAELLLMFGTSYGFVSQANAMGVTAELADARMRGLKLVVIDPALTYAASQADEWIPIRPGTDAALALSMMQVLVNELDIVDGEYLKSGTNATYLVGPDGYYVRDAESGKPQVWDAVAGRPVPYDAARPLDAALEGSFEVGAGRATTGFTLFRDHLRAYPPERVAEITTVGAGTIRRLAGEFGNAARVGATIQLDGHTLPFRPAAACFYRGVSAHRHAMHGGMSVAQLNMVVGAVDVPGGMINGTAANPMWAPEIGEDGLLVPAANRGHVRPPLPRRAVRPPETLEMVELFPLAFFSGTMMWLQLAHPELADRLGLSYAAEVLLHCRTNLVAMGADPSVMEAALRRIPFQISFATHHDETTQFADLLLPDGHGLERLGGIAYNTLSANSYTSAARPGEQWAFNLQQPVVAPAGEARFWIEVLIDLAHRLGITEEFNRSFNALCALSGPHRLEPDRAYAWPELLDRYLKSLCGDEHGLDYFREHGYYSTGVTRAVEHSYPRIFHTARVPLYLEHFLSAGKDVKSYMDARGVEWDTSDYVPLMEWKPCPAHELPAEYDLFVVNHKLPFLTASFTQENSWLADLAERNGKVYPVGINEDVAKRRGIGDGDAVWIETPSGRRFHAFARLTQGVHPECLVVPGVVGRELGTLARTRGQGIHYNSLVEYTLRQMDTVTGAVDSCVKVKLFRAEAGRGQ